MKGLSDVEMAFTFLTGLLVGGALRWGYVRFLKATIRVYEYYIQERIDKQAEPLIKVHY